MVFGVPGESYLDALDVFYDAQDRIKFVICRQPAEHLSQVFPPLPIQRLPSALWDKDYKI